MSIYSLDITDSATEIGLSDVLLNMNDEPQKFRVIMYVTIENRCTVHDICMNTFRKDYLKSDQAHTSFHLEQGKRVAVSPVTCEKITLTDGQLLFLTQTILPLVDQLHSKNAEGK